MLTQQRIFLSNSESVHLSISPSSSSSTSTITKMPFSKNRTKYLVALYKEYPCLFSGSDSFDNRNQREKAIAEILDKLQANFNITFTKGDIAKKMTVLVYETIKERFRAIKNPDAFVPRCWYYNDILSFHSIIGSLKPSSFGTDHDIYSFALNVIRQIFNDDEMGLMNFQLLQINPPEEAAPAASASMKIQLISSGSGRRTPPPFPNNTFPSGAAAFANAREEPSINGRNSGTSYQTIHNSDQMADNFGQIIAHEMRYIKCSRTLLQLRRRILEIVFDAQEHNFDHFSD